MGVRQGDQITDWIPTVHLRWYVEGRKDPELQQLYLRTHYYEDGAQPFQETIWYKVETHVEGQKMGLHGHKPEVKIGPAK